MGCTRYTSRKPQVSTFRSKLWSPQRRVLISYGTRLILDRRLFFVTAPYCHDCAAALSPFCFVMYQLLYKDLTLGAPISPRLRVFPDIYQLARTFRAHGTIDHLSWNTTADPLVPGFGFTYLLCCERLISIAPALQSTLCQPLP